MKYQAQKGNRIKHTFFDMTTYVPIWWDGKEWTADPNRTKPYSSHCPCDSVRAFRRRLKKAPRGVEFILVSRWKGHDVMGYNTTKIK